MNQEKNSQQDPNNTAAEEQLNKDLHEESPYDAYGWQFHKWPLLYALVLTVLFYAFVFFYINV